MFRTQFEPHDRVHQPVGSRFRTVYATRVDEDGRLIFTEKGVENIYDSIQSHRDSVDINVLLKRFAHGETDVLTRRQGSYGDFTRFPSTYAELLNQVIEGRELFESLPVETRAKFNHSFTEWMASMDDADFAQKMDWFKAPTDQIPTTNTSSVATAPVPEVTSNES